MRYYYFCYEAEVAVPLVIVIDTTLLCVLLCPVLAPHRETLALESAQAVIEEQKERIESLTEAVMHLQHTRGDSQQRLQRELQEYIGENQRLRLQLDSLKAEISALEQVRSRDEQEVQEVVEALAAAEKGITERDRLIKQLQVGL